MPSKTATEADPNTQTQQGRYTPPKKISSQQVVKQNKHNNDLDKKKIIVHDRTIAVRIRNYHFITKQSSFKYTVSNSNIDEYESIPIKDMDIFTEITVT